MDVKVLAHSFQESTKMKKIYLIANNTLKNLEYLLVFHGERFRKIYYYFPSNSEQNIFLPTFLQMCSDLPQ